MASCKELKVREKALDPVIEIYRISEFLPKEETYGLSDQMRRAAVSVPSYIAKGQAGDSEKDFIRFLYIAQGSRAELETQPEISVQLHYLSREKISTVETLSSQTGKMIRTLKRTLKQQPLSTTDHQPPTAN